MVDRPPAPRRTRLQARGLLCVLSCALWLGLGVAVVGALGAMTSPVARAASGNGGFVAGVEDLPLMPGLTELSGSGYAFGSSSGRIVEAYATGNVSQQQVLDFYSATLPQLGWEAATSHSYRRQGERLAIEFVKGNGPLTVHFTVTPE